MLGFGTSSPQAIEETEVWDYYHKRLGWSDIGLFRLFANCVDEMDAAFRQDFARKEEARLKRQSTKR